MSLFPLKPEIGADLSIAVFCRYYYFIRKINFCLQRTKALFYFWVRGHGFPRHSKICRLFNKIISNRIYFHSNCNGELKDRKKIILALTRLMKVNRFIIAANLNKSETNDFIFNGISCEFTIRTIFLLLNFPFKRTTQQYLESRVKFHFLITILLGN